MPNVPDLTKLPSHHFLRRTARAQEKRYEAAFPSMDFRVVSAVRGPFGFRVERVAPKRDIK